MDNLIKVTRKAAIQILKHTNKSTKVQLCINQQSDGSWAGGSGGSALLILALLIKYTHQNELEIVGLVFPPVIQKDSLIEFLDNNIPDDTGESEELTQREKELVWQSELEEHNRMVQEQNNFHL